MKLQSLFRLPLWIRTLATGLVSLFMMFVMVSSAGASTPSFKSASNDGRVVFFETEAQLVSGDTDTKRDVYERSYDTVVGAYVTREVSLGPVGGNDAYEARFEGASGDGSKVFFSAEERLVEGDTDRARDVYMRDLTAPTPTTTLVTQGGGACAPGCGGGTFPASFAAVDDAGSEVLFFTAESLVPADADKAIDLYVRELGPVGATKLVSAGSCASTCGNGEVDVSSLSRGSLSTDGSHAYFVTTERLADADADSAADIYARDLTAATPTTTLASIGECSPACENRNIAPIFGGSSAAGDRVFFSSSERLTDDDQDASAVDVYARDLPDGPTRLISGGEQNAPASFAIASVDGNHVFFTTAEPLLSGDEGANDIYEWSDGAPLQLVTPAPCSAACDVTFKAASANSTEVLFTTTARLTLDDTDDSADIYRQAIGGPPVLASRGETGWNTTEDARFNDASADASRVVFTTADGMLGEDDDGEDDIYARDLEGESTSLITTSPSYCPLPPGNCGASFLGVSEDGLRIFFRSVERFTLDDGNDEADIYERFLGDGTDPVATRLVSGRNSPKLKLGPPSPTLTATDPELSGHSGTPLVLGIAKPGSRVKVYVSSDCSGEPVATGTAEQLADPGLRASVPAGSLTYFRATAEDEGFVSGCSAPLGYRHEVEGGGGSGGGPGGGSGRGGGVTAPPARPAPPKSGGSSQPPGSPYLAPQTRITFAPAAKTRSRHPVFRFIDATGQEGTRFECKLDRGRWRRCRSPLRLKRIRRGRHLLRIRGVNGAGSVEGRPARRAFRVVRR